MMVQGAGDSVSRNCILGHNGIRIDIQVKILRVSMLVDLPLRACILKCLLGVDVEICKLLILLEKFFVAMPFIVKNTIKC